MGTESTSLETKYFHIIIMKTAASLYLWSNASCAEGKFTAWYMTRYHQKKKPHTHKTKKNPNNPKPEIPSKINYNLWDGKKW